MFGIFFRDSKGKSVSTSRWIYKVKDVAGGSMEKYKSRFVAHGFTHVEGFYYDDTFALVSQHTYIRSLFSIAADMG